MAASPIIGAASVTPTPPPLAPAVAEWTVNAKEKTATAVILGGTAKIYRSPKNEKFMCEYVREITIEGEEGPQTGAVQLSFNLNDCTNLKMAQLRAETNIRENLNKTHPDVLKAAVEEEAQAVATPAGKDPF